MKNEMESKPFFNEEELQWLMRICMRALYFAEMQLLMPGTTDDVPKVKTLIKKLGKLQKKYQYSGK